MMSEDSTSRVMVMPQDGNGYKIPAYSRIPDLVGADTGPSLCLHAGMGVGTSLNPTDIL